MYGITIVMCCASCEHCKLDKRMRSCAKGEGAVPSSYLCPDWRLKTALEQVGRGGGDIKKASYLRFSLNCVSGEDEDTPPATISDIRREYMEKYGDIYEPDI